MNMRSSRSLPWMEHFIHASLRQDADLHHRARILVATILVFMGVNCAALIAVPLINFSQFSTLVACALLIPATLIYVVLLVLLRVRGSYMTSALIMVADIMGLIVGGITLSGGAAVSPVMHLLVIPPLTAYFFGGRLWGNRATLVTLGVLAALVVAHYMGQDFIQTVHTPEQLRIAHFLTSVIGVLAISGMALIYELTASALKRERDAEHERYVRLARTDPLTGLANRRNFNELLQERIATYRQSAPMRRFALAYLDLDGFKPINDQYGHAIGDEVLRIISIRLRAMVRASDCIGRQGGDEFLLLLDLDQDQQVLDYMAQRLLKSIAQPIKTRAGIVQVTGSLGFAVFPQDASDAESLQRFADDAMYVAKREHNSWYRHQATAPAS